MVPQPTLEELSSLYTSMTSAEILTLASEGGLTARGATALAAQMQQRGLTQWHVAEHVRKLEASKPERSPFHNFMSYPIGVGVSFRGRKFASAMDFQADIRTSTRWIIAFWIPIVPLSTWRIIDLGIVSRNFLGGSRQYQVIEKVPLDWGQVLKTLIATAVGVLAVVGAFSILKT